jgi:AraC family transcriptional regulator, transcriptional activator FtrA
VFGREPDHYAWAVCAPEAGLVPTETGFDVVVPHGLEALERADTVVVPGIGDRAWPLPAAALDALRAAAGRGARVASICTGAFVLAAAGLLDGRRATTHWSYAGLLAREFPRVTVDPDVLYVDDGDVLTSAGVGAGVDLCLHMVRRDFGPRAANAVARRMVVAAHRDGGQAQFIEQPVAAVGDDRLDQAMQWAMGHLGDGISVAQMAAHAFMSPRNFSRRFRVATGTSPREWLLDRRIQATLPLLEDGALPVESVGQAVGFGPPAFRRQFRRALGISPAEYRRAFRAA